MKIRDLIFNILHSDDIYALADNLESFIILSNTINSGKSQHYYDLYDALNHKMRLITFGATKKYYIYEQREAAISFLYTNWIIAKGYKVNRDNLCKLVQVIRQEFESKSKEKFPLTIVPPLIELVNDRFSFVERIFTRGKMRITDLGYKHREYTCYYNLIAYPNKILFDNIFLCDVEETTASCENIFLHELGHLLNTRITGNVTVVPNNFHKIKNSIFKRNDIKTDLRDEEIFADFFSVAATLGTEWEDKVSLNKMIDSPSGGLIMLYMYQLINSSDRLIDWAR